MRSPAQLQRALGRLLCVILAITFCLLIFRPPPRHAAGFTFPENISLGEESTLVGTPVGLIAMNGDGLPECYRYIYHDKNGQQVAGLRMEIFYVESCGPDASNFRSLFASRSEPIDAAKSSRIVSSAEGTWLEVGNERTRFFGTRISPMGQTTITRSQLWRLRIREMLLNPVHLLRWLTTSEPIIDRRGLWMQMSVTGVSASTEQAETIWKDAVTAVSARARESLQGR